MFENLKTEKQTESFAKEETLSTIQAEREELMQMSEKELMVESIMTMKLLQAKLDLLLSKTSTVAEEVDHIFYNTSR